MIALIFLLSYITIGIVVSIGVGLSYFLEFDDKEKARLEYEDNKPFLIIVAWPVYLVVLVSDYLSPSKILFSIFKTISKLFK